MKILTTLLMTVSLFMSLGVQAADAGDKETGQKQQEMQKQHQVHREMQKTEKEASTVKVTELLGRRIENPNGEQLGNITDVVIDLEEGRVAYAVLSFGGFLGMGDKLFAIPFSALKEQPERKSFILDVQKEKLQKAPGFDKNDWPETGNRRWGEEVHRYYGQEPYWEQETQKQTE